VRNPRQQSKHTIEHLAVVAHDVHDVGLVLEPPFDLERRHPSRDQVAEMWGQIQIAQGEQMLVGDHNFPLGVHQGIASPAGLRALSAVATAPAHGVAERALAAHTYTQGTVDEDLKLDGRCGVDFTDLVQVELAGKNRPRETHLFQKGHAFGRVVVHLRAGNERQGRQVAFQQADVLNDEPVHTCAM
jgi:hypothetical protein